ncbi:PREDICTED: splicing factor, proline- and glutamine-rich-like [Chrysochloris asiatica]|uniref:Splicing factor, proline- and glutamine-rich-like n=1 Tax=Chrysochloris asiatica TaxID=185453 RepID=A0A9B0UDS4_CHRAS|nr:PREDICTED: splicing factor, proline- and glutamine-rich-like [Chrysochloris asiatica]
MASPLSPSPPPRDEFAEDKDKHLGNGSGFEIDDHLAASPRPRVAGVLWTRDPSPSPHPYLHPLTPSPRGLTTHARLPAGPLSARPRAGRGRGELRAGSLTGGQPDQSEGAPGGGGGRAGRSRELHRGGGSGRDGAAGGCGEGLRSPRQLPPPGSGLSAVQVGTGAPGGAGWPRDPWQGARGRGRPPLSSHLHPPDPAPRIPPPRSPILPIHPPTPFNVTQPGDCATSTNAPSHLPNLLSPACAPISMPPLIPPRAKEGEETHPGSPGSGAGGVAAVPWRPPAQWAWVPGWH